MDALGKRVAEVRKSKGVTQEQLAALTGLDRVAIAYIETGKRMPRVTSIYKIAVGLGVDVSELFRGL
jgi:transcriptional regulator with XRE-family HTH domain